MIASRLTVGVRAPEFPSNMTWINSEPLSLKALKGCAVLIDFWTYSCVNCLRTLVAVKQWHERYAAKGLVIVGVHTPEFAFEAEEANVRRAVEELGIDYPVVLDSSHQVWDLYANHWWPRKLLVDGDGTIVHDHVGEGGYAQTEEAIQGVLRGMGARRLPPVARDDEATIGVGGVCENVTPETYLGYARGRYANTNIEARHVVTYRTPRGASANLPALEGEWLIEDEYAESHGGMLTMPYAAAEVNLVMALAFGSGAVTLELDGKPISHIEAGDDVSFEGREAIVHVDEPRMYRLVLSRDVRDGRLTLRVSEGVRLYAFTFGGAC